MDRWSNGRQLAHPRRMAKDHSLLSHTEEVVGESPLWMDSPDEQPTEQGVVVFSDIKRPFGKSGTKTDFQHRVEDTIGNVTDDNAQAVAAGERARGNYESGEAVAEEDPLGDIVRQAALATDPVGVALHTSQGHFYLNAEWNQAIGKVSLILYRVMSDGSWIPAKSFDANPIDFR